MLGGGIVKDTKKKTEAYLKSIQVGKGARIRGKKKDQEKFADNFKKINWGK